MTDDDLRPPPGLDGASLDCWFAEMANEAAHRAELAGIALDNVNRAALAGDNEASAFLAANGYPFPPPSRS